MTDADAGHHPEPRRHRGTGVLLRAGRELLAQRTRLAATLLALVLSVGFVAAALVFTGTERRATTLRQVEWASRADVVIETHRMPQDTGGRDLALQAAEDHLRHDPDIHEWEELSFFGTTMVRGGDFRDVMIESTPQHPDLRWYRVVQGREARSTSEIVLSSQACRALDAGIGSQVQLGLPGSDPFTVVGITDESDQVTPTAHATLETLHQLDSQDATAVPSDAVADPRHAADRTPFTSGSGTGRVLLATARPGVDADGLVTHMVGEFKGGDLLEADPRTVAQVRLEAAEGHLGGVRQSSGLGGTAWLNVLVVACGVVALVVGSLVVATTFSVLVARRRQQTGLLRAVGASRAQVVGQVEAEALVLGVVGALVGTALGVATAWLLCRTVTHSARFGLVLSWPHLAVVAAAGVLAAAAVAIPPVLAAGRTSPMAALRQGDTNAMGPRALRRRALVTVALAVVGAVLLAAGLHLSPAHGQRLRLGEPGAGVVCLLMSAVLGAPLYVAPMLRCLQRPVRRRPVLLLAVRNGVSNRARAGSAIASLVLATALLVLVQVSAASSRAGAHARVDQQYPADLVMQSAYRDADAPYTGPTDAQMHVAGFRSGALQQVQAVPGVRRAMMLPSTDGVLISAGDAGGTAIYTQVPLMGFDPRLNALLHHPVQVDDRQVGLSEGQMRSLQVAPGDSVTLMPMVGNPIQLNVVPVNLSNGLGLVSPASLRRMHIHTKPGVIVAQVSGEKDAARVLATAQSSLMADNPGLVVSGNTSERARLDAVVASASRIATGMLAVVVVVALVGMANVLGLSVLERRRELALLRALGMTRGSLRTMLLAEALVLGVLALAVGIPLGVTLGWATAHLATQVLAGVPAPWVVPWGAIGAGGAAVLAAAVLASVLPGRSAAGVPPVEGLADLG